jgi:hypothetical protein
VSPIAVYQNGAAVEIFQTVYDAFGVPGNPVSAYFDVADPLGDVTRYEWGISTRVANPGPGEFTLSLPSLYEPGLWEYDFVAVGGLFTVENHDQFTLLPDDGATRVLSGPCKPWIGAADVPITPIPEDANGAPIDLTPYAWAASEMLYELSGRQFTGACLRTVRPCQGSCGCWGGQVLSRGHIVQGWDGSGWGCECGSSYCRSCGSLSQVLLPGYPVWQIEEVLIDGAVVAPSSYRIDRRRWLTGTNGTQWPACQSLDLASSEVGTFEVTYFSGQDPPVLGTLAAMELSKQIYQGFTGGACELPGGVVRITRQGLTIDKLAALSWAFGKGGWRTGLSLVDAFLGSVNGAGLRRRPVVWAPRCGPAKPVGQLEWSS